MEVLAVSSSVSRAGRTTMSSRQSWSVPGWEVQRCFSQLEGEGVGDILNEDKGPQIGVSHVAERVGPPWMGVRGEPFREVRRLRPPLAHSPAHALVSASGHSIFQGHVLKDANLLPYSQHNCLLDTEQKGVTQIH